MTEPQRVFAPTFNLNYRADVSHMVGEIVGPNRHGEFFRAIEAERDGDRWRVTFELVTADEVRQLLQRVVA